VDTQPNEVTVALRNVDWPGTTASATSKVSTSSNWLSTTTVVGSAIVAIRV
jgi:hypothetical protein